MPPLGLACVAGVLEKDGHDVAILDCVLEGIDERALERQVAARRPDIVGITGTTWTRYEQFRAARASKRALAGVPVVLGGPHVTFTGRNVIEKIPEVDFVVRGEGELPMRDLVRGYDDPARIGTIPGLVFRDRNGQTIENPIGAFIKDLDTIPEPARHLLDIPAYRQTFFGKQATTVMTSRGCPVFCSFCSTSVMWGRTYRRMSPARVVQEVGGVLDRFNLEAIWFFDDTLTLNRDHIVGMLDEMERHHLTFTWYCEVRVNTVDYDLLKRMHSLGCRFVSFGVESGSPRVIKRIHKGITLPQVQNVLDWCVDLGIYTKVFFMLGLPEETFEDGMMTVDYIKRVRSKINQVALSAGCSIMPGTEVERFAIERGLMAKDFDWTAEVYYPENRMNNRPVSVPTLFQPQLGLAELNRLKFEYYGAGAVNWPNIRSRLRVMRRPGDVWNLLRLLGIFLRYAAGTRR